MKHFLLVPALLVTAICSYGCQYQQHGQGAENPAGKSVEIKLKAKPIVQSVPDRVYEHLNPGDNAPDAVTIDADEIMGILNGTAVIRKGSEEALIDFKGKFIVDWGLYHFWINDHRSPVNTLYRVSNEIQRSEGFINVKGEEVFAPVAGQTCMNFTAYGLTVFSNGTNKKWVDITGQEHPVKVSSTDIIAMQSRNPLNQPRYAEAIPVFRQQDRGVSPSATENFDGYIFVDLQNKQTVPGRYLEVGWFTEGLAPVRVVDQFSKALWGYINTKGEMVIKPNFTNRPGQFHNGLALIQPKLDAEVDFKYAYIDRKGNIKIKINSTAQLPYIPADGTFVNGYAFWQSGSKDCLMDTSGTMHPFSEIINDPAIIAGSSYVTVNKYNDWGIFFTVAKRGGGQGLMDYKGNIIIPPAFSILMKPDYYSHYAIASFFTGKETASGQSIFKTGIVNRQGVFVLTVEPKQTL